MPVDEWKLLQEKLGPFAQREMTLDERAQQRPAARASSEDDSPEIVWNERPSRSTECIVPSQLAGKCDSQETQDTDDAPQDDLSYDIPEDEPESPRPPTPNRAEEEASFESLAKELGLSPPMITQREGEVQDVTKGDCQTLYEESSKDMKLLFVMALGLKDTTGRWIADVNHCEVYKGMNNKSSVTPTLCDMRKEMKRRAHKVGLQKFRKNSLNKAECETWLKLNPVTDFKDIVFLRREELKMYMVVVEAQKESEKLKEQKRLVANWCGNKPWLRLYCSMFADQALKALKPSDAKWTREQLDGRNSDQRPLTCVEVVTKLHNSPSIVFCTEAFSWVSCITAFEIQLS